MRTIETAFVSLTLALTALGFIAAYLIHFPPLIPIELPVEPFESAFGVPWRYLVALYVFLVLLGTAAIASAAEVLHIKELEVIVKDAVVIAILSIIVGLITISVDLERIERGGYAVLGHANPTSVMYWMIMFYILEVIFLIIEAWFYFRSDLVKQAELKGIKGKVGRIVSLRFVGEYIQDKYLQSPALNKLAKYLTSTERTLDLEIARPIGVVALITAILAYSNLGALFAASYIPLWHDAITPIYFVVTAIVGGSAILILATIVTSWAKGSNEKISALPILRNILGFSLAIAMLFTAWRIVIVGYPGVNYYASFSIQNLMFGEYLFNFWVIEVLIGMVIPLFILIFAGNNVKAMLTSALMVIAGIFTFRYDFLFAGQIVKNISGIAIPTHPHPFEIMFTLGALSLVALAYYAVYKILPMEVEHAS
ncbi:MAG: polysulfide reductase NrfD [Archaeoglobaceae archaeon]|nr:polysulfide reductase NrfD [Archaeoglobaceae archaeon]MDW8117497.1 NrfD/PsrC family molybdoenzyme membrane anchor subunit [Archaeoglobaceae archaeon]